MCVCVCVFDVQDYFDIVKKPIDLSMIKRKLDSGQYQDPWQYVDDVWLMFDNAWLYNRKASRIHKYASKVTTPHNITRDYESIKYICRDC